MKFPGFVGPTYQSRSVVVDGQRCINLYPEIVESGTGKSALAFYRTPGLSLFATLDNSPVRTLYEINGRVFAIAGANLIEIFSDGTSTIRGVVPSVGWCNMDSNGVQLILCSGGLLFCYTLLTDTLTPIAAPAAQRVMHSDLYFIAQEPDSQKIWVSSLLDGLTWDPLDFASAEAAPDNLVQIIADHRELWLFGTRTIQPYYNSGAADFPFEPIAGSLIETGSAGMTVAKCDNTLFWLSQDERGNGMVWRSEGFRPVRVSTHAIEHLLQRSTRLDEAYSYSYQEDGHTFYILIVPGATSALVYDASTGQWHERAYWNGPAGLYELPRQQCHCMAWGKHLVGDRVSGKVYLQSIEYYDDAGDALRWLRRAPHLANENKSVFYGRFELEMDTGAAAASEVMMRWSNDGGRNWSNELMASLGAIGDTWTRVYWHRLGKGRDRVFEVSGSAAVPIAITDANLELTPGVN